MHLPPPGTEFKPVPSGAHAAICYQVVDLGTQQSTFNGETKIQRKILLRWEIPAEMMDDGRPFSIGKRYTLSSHSKAALRHDLESWRGIAFKEEEIQKFDIATLLGKPCMLTVVHTERNGQVYANVAALARLPKGMTTAKQHNETLYLSLDDFDMSAFGKLSETMQGIIKQSPEYQQLMHAPDERESPPPHDGGYTELDDEIPF